MRRWIAFGALLLAGCSTVSNGPMQRIGIDSEPRGAAVALRNCGTLATRRLTTPGVAWVSRRSTQCEFVFRKPYFDDQRVRLRRRTAPIMASYGQTADLLLDTAGSLTDFAVIGAALLLPGLAVDAASGSMFELEPHEMRIRLVPVAQDWRERRAP